MKGAEGGGEVLFWGWGSLGEGLSMRSMSRLDAANTRGFVVPNPTIFLFRA